MKYPRLLAKSIPEGEAFRPSHGLPGHLEDVYRAASQVLASTAQDQLSALGLASSHWRSRLEEIVRLGAAVHDLGKANDHFSRMVTGNSGSKAQGLRHEWVTILILLDSAWQEWLRPALCMPDDFDFVLWAVAAHHPGHDRPSPPLGPPAGAGVEMQFLLGHRDFACCVDWLRRVFNLTAPPPLTDRKISLLTTRSGSAFRLLRSWSERATERWENTGPEERRLVAAAKACILAADVAGSALPRTSLPSNQHAAWIKDAFAHVPSANDLCQIVTERLKGNTLREFQRRGAESTTRVTFVRAGCGSGKTILAYQWAAQRAPGKRVYLCYPTTGTATEGFHDYLLDDDQNGKFGAELFHSRAAVDLELLGVKDEEDDQDVRIYSLDAWSTPIVCCTVDTVLGLMQNNRKGLQAWPALAGAAFIFDEIHSYDTDLFGALLRFLKELQGAPVLLMTASLPEARLTEIRRVLAKQQESLTEIAGPKDLENLPRYHSWQGPVTTPLQLVHAAFVRNEKVLWVCNTVGRVMQVVDQAAALDLPARIYHSRFKYRDRVRHHREVIDAFDPKKNSRGALAICSQVAEMSLDLSATLLVSDLATIAALIQRLGRLNRRARPAGEGEEQPPTMPFFIVQPLDSNGELMALPYTLEELQICQQWLNSLGMGPITQANLIQCWQNLPRTVESFAPASCWLDGGPQTKVRPLRQPSPGITVILEEDLAQVKSGTPLVEVALPMPDPRGLPWRQWKRHNGVPVAPTGSINYNPERGAEWQR
jgi:CRISPR-associated endonuclease/helicase Cas3